MSIEDDKAEREDRAWHQQELVEKLVDQILKQNTVLDAIRKELDQVPWSPDTIQAIAQLIHQAGYRFREPR